MSRHGAVLAVAVGAGAQQDDSRQRDPATDGMHHDGAGKVVKFISRCGLDPGLHAEVLVPGNTFEERVHKADDDSRCDQLRPEFGAFGDSPRNDGGNGGGKRQQEEELHQVVTVLRGQLIRTDKEGGAIGHRIAHQKVGHGGDRKVDQDLDQCIDLVLFANRAQLQKCEPGMHGQNHDAAQQNEQGIRALLQCIHINL